MSTTHFDERRVSYYDIFPNLTPTSQINVSVIYSTETVTAWHAHEIQTDYWFVAQGIVKVGLARILNETTSLNDIIEWNASRAPVRFWADYDSLHPMPIAIEWLYMTPESQPLTINPRIFHGYKAVTPGAILLYHLDKKYDPTDEYKVLPGHFGENWRPESK